MKAALTKRTSVLFVYIYRTFSVHQRCTSNRLTIIVDVDVRLFEHYLDIYGLKSMCLFLFMQFEIEKLSKLLYTISFIRFLSISV